MSYIDILVLRHLSRPAHGYELRKRIEATTGLALNNNSLYPALRRFEEAGAVTRTVEPQQGRPARNVYELTGVGRDLLHDLVAELPADQAADDLEFMTRLGQFSLLAPAEQEAVLDARDHALAQRIARVTELRERARGDFWSAVVTSEVIRRDTSERKWLASLRAAGARHSVPEDRE